MVEGGLLPAFIAVAGLALRTISPLVQVILRMAGRACFFQFSGLHIVAMAGIAGGLLVCITQPELGFMIMVKSDIRPRLRRMAFDATGAVIPVMHIILAMTGGTFHWHPLVMVIGVTQHAKHLPVLALQGKCCLVMIKPCLAPGIRVMAV